MQEFQFGLHARLHACGMKPSKARRRATVCILNVGEYGVCTTQPVEKSSPTRRHGKHDLVPASPQEVSHRQALGDVRQRVVARLQQKSHELVSKRRWPQPVWSTGHSRGTARKRWRISDGVSQSRFSSREIVTNTIL